MFEPLITSSFISTILVHTGLVILAVLCFVIYLTKKDSRIAKYLRNINGPTGLPLVGNALSLLVPHEHLIGVILNWVKEHGFFFHAWIANVPYVIVCQPNYVEKILSSTVHINKGKDYESFLEAWLGTGLLTARREKWHTRRKMLTPTFHFKILEDFLPVFNTNAKILNVMLEKQRMESDTFDICPFISRLTLDVICETAMGEKINAQMGGETDYVAKVCGLSDLILVKGLNPLYRIQYIWNMTNFGKMEAKYLQDLHEFTDKMIRDRKAERKRSKLVAIAQNALSGSTENTEENTDGDHVAHEGTKTRKAFLDLLLDLQEEENLLSDADIREEVDTFMFEGHDTTGANLEWAILLLACHPEYQKLIHDELDAVLGSEDLNRDLTSADLKQLKFMECCLKEALRLYPSVPFFMRRVEEDILLDEDKIIPTGTTVIVAPFVVHRHPETFPDPEKFDPYRFASETKRHPFGYIPFSAGPRNCIGQKFALMEEKIILATFLKKFRVEAVDTRETVLALPDVILRPKDGIKIRLVNRYK